VLRASVAAERSGVKTVSILGRGFEGQASAIAAAFGLPDIAVAVYPGQIVSDSDEQLRDTIRDFVVDQVVAGLTGEGTGSNG
jgi:hypothetical protein